MRNGTILALLLAGGVGTAITLRRMEPPVVMVTRAPVAEAATTPPAPPEEPKSAVEVPSEDDNRDFDSVPDGPLFYDFMRWMMTAPGVIMPETPERRLQLVETWRTASPQLRRYQELGQHYNDDLGVADRIHRCGLRDENWWYRVEQILRRRGQSDPAIIALRQHLSRDEIDAADAYQTWQMVQQEQFYFGNGQAEACADMAGMPFVYRFDNLR